MVRAFLIPFALLLCSCGGLQTVQWPAHEPVSVHPKPPENPKLPLPRQESFGEAEVGFRIEYQTGGLMNTPGHVVRNTQYRHSPWVDEPLDIDLLVHLELRPKTPLPEIELERTYKPANEKRYVPGISYWRWNRSRQDYRGAEPRDEVLFTPNLMALPGEVVGGPIELHQDISYARATAFEDGSRRLTLRMRWRFDPEVKDWKVSGSKLRFTFPDGYEVAWPLFP